MNQINNNKQFLTPKLSSKYIYIVGAAGTAVKERYTTPLRVTTSDEDTLKPTFLFSKCCLARDAGKRCNVCSRVNSILH